MKHIYLNLGLKVQGVQVIKKDGGTFLSILLEDDTDVAELRKCGAVLEDEADLPADLKTDEGAPKHSFLGVEPLEKGEAKNERER